ncbi:MAG: MFS transporter, partial [Candidatus Rokubacteria bacterium]|nr:MFS transporter [Candidatus Rokubacteria bacterium]
MRAFASPGARSIAVTFVTLGLSYGVWYAYSVFLVALLREFGWSRSLVAGAFSVFVLVHGVLAPPLGWLADRVGPRRLFLAGGLTLAAALWLDGAVERPWHLYVAFGVVTAAGVACAGWVPAVILVQRWFPRRVGAALGITSAGIGVGIFLVVPLTQLLVDQLGWRAAFRCLAAAVALWIVPASLLALRDPVAGSELAGGGSGEGPRGLGGGSTTR